MLFVCLFSLVGFCVLVVVLCSAFRCLLFFVFLCCLCLFSVFVRLFVVGVFPCVYSFVVFLSVVFVCCFISLC